METEESLSKKESPDKLEILDGHITMSSNSMENFVIGNVLLLIS